MNKCTVCRYRPQSLQFCLDPLPRDKRLPFIESVCAVLIESRFGPGRSFEYIEDHRHTPDARSDMFNDVISGRFAPPCEAGIEALYKLPDENETDLAALRRNAEYKKPATHNRPLSTLGRGSPDGPTDLDQRRQEHRRCEVFQPAATPQVGRIGHKPQRGEVVGRSNYFSTD